MNYYNNQQREQPTCNTCKKIGKEIPIKFKKRDDGGWDRFNLDGTPHDRNYCDSIKAGGGSTEQKYVAGIIIPDKDNKTGAIDPHLNSILIKVSDLQRKVELVGEQNMELKQLLFNLEKSAQTNATVIDTMAQKIELILAKSGYPGPEQIINDMATAKMPKPINTEMPKPNMVQVGGTYIEDDDKALQEENIAQNIEKHENNEAFQKEITQNLIKDMPTDTQKEAFVMAKDKAAQIFKEQVLPAMERTTGSKGKPWTPISEMFTCDSCHTKSANGFEKYGTKICPNCNDEFEMTKQQSQQLDKEEFDKMNTEYDY